jgi:ribonuclease PH
MADSTGLNRAHTRRLRAVAAHICQISPEGNSNTQSIGKDKAWEDREYFSLYIQTHTRLKQVRISAKWENHE